MDSLPWGAFASIIGAFVAGAVAVLKLLASALNKKADKDQVDKHHTAILDLYGKHDKVIDLMREKEERDVTRHLSLLDAINKRK